MRKDLRTVLKRKVRGKYSRALLRRRQAAALPAGAAALAARRDPRPRAATSTAATRSARDEGKPGDQWCYDAVRQRPVGGATQPLIHWINRPTYQQVVEVQGAAPR